jgi:S-adenosylmethionine-dependent methyltransferase
MPPADRPDGPPPVFTGQDLARLKAAFARPFADDFLTTPAGQQAADAELNLRHYWYRERYVPWLESVEPLKGKKVLEVGTGYGSSAVAMAEAGAMVVGVDLNDAFFEVALLRAEICGVNHRLDLQKMNAADLAGRFPLEHFEMVAFMAVLEHMTFSERRASLAAGWDVLAPGGLLVITDTPNRLWYRDDHTSFEDFFHWLPDEVAVEWARRSDRADLVAAVNGGDPMMGLARQGRGVGYHDLVLALGEVALTATQFGEWEYRRAQDPVYAQWWADTPMARYQAFLREVAPDIPLGYLESELAVCLRKPL